MTRFAWMQFRAQAAVAFGALVIVAVVAGITGAHLLHLYDTTVTNCGAKGDCATATAAFLRHDYTLSGWLNVLVVVVPGLVGVFWGAPLVARELEAGSFRLAWTQSVTRTRWLAVKLAVVGLASMVLAGLVSLLVTWWSSPVDRVHMNPFGSFDQRDVVPIGYAAFAFALGVTAGVLIRRTLPAMASALVAFVGVRLAVVFWARPRLIAPVVRYLPLDTASTGFGSTNGGPFLLEPAPPNIPGAWIISTRIVDKAGHGLSAQGLADTCPRLGAGALGGRGSGAGAAQVPAAVQQVVQDCVAKLGARFHEVASYQPASRYWTFQWYELAIYLGAALVLGGFCTFWVRRRLS